MKTLKVFAITLLTFGAVSAAKAQVQVSLSAHFGTPVTYYEAPPVVVERPVIYERPIVYHPRPVVVARPVYYRRPAVVYAPRTVVYERPVRYRAVKYYGPGRGHAWGHYKHGRHHRH